MSSQLKTNLTQDPPIKLDASYQFSPIDRRYIDDQALAAQEHIVNSLIGGVHATWFYLAALSSAVDEGDTVAASFDANNTTGVPTVTFADSGALSAAGGACGVVLKGAAPGTRVLVAIGGILDPSVTGLPASSGVARVNTSTGQAEHVASFSSSDYPLGSTNSHGELTLGLGPQLGLLGGAVVNGPLVTTPPSATGSKSLVGGHGATDTGHNSCVVLGENAESDGQSSIAIGEAATASGGSSVSLGPGAEAGDIGIAIGLNANAGQNGIALGQNATAGANGFAVTGTTASSATGGARSLPANPADFFEININGTDYKIPLYNT